MRIGLVCPYSFEVAGGVQNHVLGLARSLVAAGHTAHILAPGTPDRTWFRPGAAADPVAGGVEFTSAGGAVPVPYNGSIARVNFGPLSAGRVRRWLRAGDFDLVHLHEPITPSIALQALWAADVPVVATFHTATPRSRTMQLARSVLQASIDKIGAGIAVSESARRVVVQHLGRDAAVIPNGFDFAAFAPAHPLAPDDPLARAQTAPARPLASGLAAGPLSGLPLSEKWSETTTPTGVSLSSATTFRGSEEKGGRGGGRAPRIAFLGRVDEYRKGLAVLLDAVPAIRRALGAVEVVVAGRGRIAAPEGVRLLGAVSDAEKVALLAGCDVFVAPHLERESFGIVLLEAMAAGAPVVASGLPAFRDLLRPGADGPVGTMVPTGDSAALADAVVRTVLRPDADRVARARERARGYDWSVVAPAITAVYRTVLGLDASLPDPSGSAARFTEPPRPHPVPLPVAFRPDPALSDSSLSGHGSAR